MKKKLSRILALVLAMVMALGVTAMAADPVDTPTENSKATIIGANGAQVTFDQTVDPVTGKKNPEKILVTYEQAGLTGQFLIMMVTATEKGGALAMNTPGPETILYIDQVEAKDADADTIPDITFEVYPSAIKDSVIMIYGLIPNPEDPENPHKSLQAAIVEGKYILGDLDLDGKILATDGVAMSLHLAGLEMLTGNAFSAGDIDGDGKITAVDGVFLRQRLAGIITDFN